MNSRQGIFEDPVLGRMSQEGYELVVAAIKTIVVDYDLAPMPRYNPSTNRIHLTLGVRSEWPIENVRGSVIARVIVAVTQYMTKGCYNQQVIQQVVQLLLGPETWHGWGAGILVFYDVSYPGSAKDL